MEKIGKKLKHDHTLTSILKFAIFSMVMLAPIFSVASRCLYVICNKNAKDSYSKKVNNDSYELIDSLSDFNLNNYYLFDSSTFINTTSSATGSYSRTISYTNFNLITYNGNVSIDFNQYNQFGLYIAQDGVLSISFRDNNSNQSSTLYFYSSQLAFTFSYISNSLNYNFASTNIFYVFNTNANYYLDNAFEYSLSQLEESEYYNWATNLGIYTPINNMVSGMGGHSVISLLLAYWSIYTAIYIVFDIIITCFVKITHLIQGE